MICKIYIIFGVHKMSEKFMHVGKFIVKPENQQAFIDVMKRYEKAVKQEGLDHSHLIEAESEPNLFWYVTIWSSKAAWEAVENLEGHKKMHLERDPLLAQPANQNFGKVIV